MKKLLVVVALSLAFTVRAELHRHEAGAGQTIGIGYGASKQDPGNTGSQLSCYYDIHDGGILRYDTTQDTSTIWNPIVATNGLAVLDVTGWPTGAGHDLILNGGVYTAGGKGYLQIKGLSQAQVYIGSSSAGSFASTGVTDVRRVDFVDEDGNPVQKTVYYYTANLAGIVTNATWRMVANQHHRLVGNVPVLPGTEYTVTGNALYIGNGAAVGADQTITVGSGNKTLAFWAANIVCDPTLQDGIARPFAAVSAITRLDVSFSAVLSDSTAKMSFGDADTSVKFGGTVTGAGKVSIKANRVNDEIDGTIGVPVEIGSGTTLTLGDGASLAKLVPADATVRIKVLSGTAALGDLTGTITLSGEGKTESFLDVTGAPEGATIIEETSATVLFNGSATPAGNVMIRTLPDGRREIRFGADASQLPALSTPYEAYEMGDGAVYAKVPTNANLRASEGVTATVRTDGADGDAVSLSLRGGTVALGTSPAYWFDFSRTNTLRRIGEGTTTQYLDRDFIERCVDWRQPDADRSLWNRRCYNTTFDYQDGVMPIPVWNGLNGKTYLSFGNAGNSRRLPTSDGVGWNTMKGIPAQMVIMVFGSQNGGGMAMVATDYGRLVRSGTTINDPIANTDEYDVWLDGEKVQPTTTKFNQGWQVVSVNLKGAEFRGLGFRAVLSTDETYGGQDYAEVLVFTNAVSDRVRCETEAYLAKKWGISTYSAAAMGQAEAAKTTVNAEGAGTIEATTAGTLELGGNFAGTVRLNGGALTVKDAPLPYTAETLPRTNLLGWYDPDCRETVKLYRDLNPSATTEEIRYIVNRAKPDVETGDKIMLGVGFRMPSAVPLALGYGLSRTWMDYDGTTTDVNGGNTMRFVAYNSGTDYAGIGTSPSATPFSVGTGFIVVDSRRTAFTAFQSDVQGTGGDFRRRTGAAIWGAGSSANVTGGETRLNGCVVADQSKGFNKCPELLSFRPTANASGAFFANFNDTETKITSGVSLLMGESIFYSTKLSDEDTARIEGYLMTKWLGLMPPTCVDPREATVAGFGTVKVDDIAKLPRFDAAFVGEVSVAAKAASGSFSVTIDPETDEVVGGLVTPEATVTLPAACTLTVDFSPAPEELAGKRSWTVFDCKGYSAPVEWTLAFANPSLAAKFKFVRQGNAIIVKPQCGLILMVR